MSISFSGLASGLDSTSWVESLTALKRAKVETLEAEKKSATLSLDTLNNIKSFFAGFRSVIEKITDSKFGSGNLDLFAQNLALSSKAEVVSATATTAAQEASYQVNVHNLATQSKVASNCDYTTTTTVSSTATLGSTLGSLGVKSGTIGVTVDGVNKSLSISESDTLRAFINKLRNIGVEAHYNSSTGVFSVNANTFTDTQNTGIVDALHLTNFTKGYITNALTTSTTSTVTQTATSSTKLSVLGVKSGTIKLTATDSTNDRPYSIQIDANSTIQDLVNGINNLGDVIHASFNNGVFTLINSFISDDSTTNLIDAFGLQNPKVLNAAQSSGQLIASHSTSSSIIAGRTTLLKDIASSVTINGGETITVNNAQNQSSTITISQTTTIGDVIDKLNAAGLSASINSAGIVSIDNGKITGGTLDLNTLFNLTEAGNSKIATTPELTYTTTQGVARTSRRAITYREASIASLSDNISDFVNIDRTKSITIFNADGTSEDFIWDGIYTFRNLCDLLSSNGINASMNDGVISLSSSEGKYVVGLEALGITTNTTTIATSQTVGLPSTSSNALTYNETVYATASDLISDFISPENLSQIKLTIEYCDPTRLPGLGLGGSLNSNSDKTKTMDNFTTFQDMFNWLEEYDIHASFENGQIIFDNAGEYRVTSTSGYGFDLTFYEDNKPISVFAIAKQSSVLVSSSSPVNENDRFSDFYPSGLMICDQNNRIIKQFLPSSTETIADVINSLKDYSITATIGDGYLEINNPTLSYYAKPASVSAKYKQTLRLAGPGTTFCTTSTYAETVSPSTSAINLMVNGTATTVDLTGKTIQDVFNQLESYGMTCSMVDGVVEIKGTNDAYVTDFNGALGITGPGYSSITAAHKNLKNNPSEVISRTDTKTATTSTTFGQISGASNGYVRITTPDGSTRTISAAADKTIGQFFNELSAYGIDGSIKDGYITITPNNDNYKISEISGFGINNNAPTSGNYTVVTGTTTGYINTDSNQIKKNFTKTVNEATTLADIGITDNSQYIKLALNNGSALLTFDLKATDTFQNIKNKLAIYDISLSISDGKITLTPNDDTVIYSMSTDLQRKLNLPQGELFYTTTINQISEDVMDKIRLCDLRDSSGTSLGINYSFNLIVDNNGTKETISLNSNTTLSEFKTLLNQHSIKLDIADGKLIFTGEGNAHLTTNGASSSVVNMLNALNLNDANWVDCTTYRSSESVNVKPPVTTDTKLSDLGITSGAYNIITNDGTTKKYVNSSSTLGDFISALESYGIYGSLSDGQVNISSMTGAYLATSTESGASNIVDVLFNNKSTKTYQYTSKKLETSSVSTTTRPITESTKINDIDISSSYPPISTGNLGIILNDSPYQYNFSANATVGDFLNKFRALGIGATLSSDGVIKIQYKDEILVNTANSLTRLGLTASDSLDGYSATDVGQKVTSYSDIVKYHTGSAMSYANYDTKLSTLGVTSGTFSIFENGHRTVFEIEDNETFGSLRDKINEKYKFGGTGLPTVDLVFDDGYLQIKATDIVRNPNVAIGATTDTSNFAAIVGILGSEENKSSGRLYCGNNTSLVTQSGLFRKGNVTEGDFTVGNAKIEITDKTTIDDIIAQINYSDKSNATAYWDAVNSNLVIKSKSGGASLINIEAGTSNFTDILGYTSNSILNYHKQEVGENARFSINGTEFISSSNIVGSDVSRIEGVTLNLKDITKDNESITITIEKDKETAATAVSEVVDAYNELIDKIDQEVSRSGNLSHESTLKLIRNQIRSLMTGSIATSGSFKNLSSIGIELDAATKGNIRTDNINKLSFNKGNFLKAYTTDLSSLKSVLVGDDKQKGILTNVEDLLEQSLASVTGYFASAEKSFNNKISKLNSKIDKTNTSADRYKARLEAKFQVMDRMISTIQDNYSSFLK